MMHPDLPRLLDEVGRGETTFRLVRAPLVHGGRLLLDLVAVPDSADEVIVDAVRRATERAGS
jgi:hypothetical protein